MSGACLTRTGLQSHVTMPRIATTDPDVVDGVTVGEWTLTRAAFTDRHAHAEINVVLAGELHVTCRGETHVLQVGDRIVVPGGELARYAAPEYARMVWVYGPGPAGAADTRYEEL